MPADQSIALNFIAAGVNAFVGAPRSTGSESGTRWMEWSLIYNDTSVGEALRHSMEVNPAQLSQVWTNLISNAIKYTPARGRVRVSLQEEDGWAVGRVADTGIGIAPDDLTHIFEEFYRAPQAKEIDAHGTGLGLALVKRIVDGLGGTLEVESTPGKGSRFTVRLPTAARAAQERDSKGL